MIKSFSHKGIQRFFEKGSATARYRARHAVARFAWSCGHFAGSRAASGSMVEWTGGRAPRTRNSNMSAGYLLATAIFFMACASCLVTRAPGHFTSIAKIADFAKHIPIQ